VPVESANTPSAGLSSPTDTGPGFVGTTTRRGVERDAGEMRLGPGNGEREPPADSSARVLAGGRTSRLSRREIAAGRRRDVTRLHLETDASLNPGQRKVVEGVSLKRAGGGIVLRSPSMLPVGVYSVSLGFLSSTLTAEALVLLRGMKVARQRHGATTLRARTDSAHLVEIVNGRAKARDPTLRTVVEQIVAERDQLAGFEIRWSPSTHARERQAGVPTADALARKAAGLGVR